MLLKLMDEKVKVKSVSCVQLFSTLWTVAHQAPPPMGFSRQEYWSGLPFLSPGDLPDSGIELQPPALQSHQGIPEKGGVHARPEGCDEDTGIGGVEGGFHILREWIRRNVVKNI